MEKRFKNKKIPKLCLVVCLCLFILGTSNVLAVDSRIVEIRTQFREDPQSAVAVYQQEVSYQDILESPSVNELYSYAYDNEEFTRDLLSQFREASQEADSTIRKWVGDEILIAVIDSSIIYGAVFDLKTGELRVEYVDTKTEVWVDLGFLQELIRFGDTHSIEESINLAIDHYYTDWAAWNELGPFDILVTRETIMGFSAVAGVSLGLYQFKFKKK